MIDKVTVTDPGLNWDWWWYTGYALAAVGLIALAFWAFSFMTSSRSSTVRLRNIAWVLMVVAVVGAPVGALANWCVSATTRTTNIEAEKDRQIEELGYLNLDKESDYYQYTAVKDNEYVRIAIIEYPTLTWHIVPLDMSTEKE